ncbi:hypothetical protein OH491_13335 [Termitidicoccus mucosus]|uniref:Uncharacterized protein n=1 Tax=Termitidicoccus mucosus TaxID=1184151 RepID=A0A178IIZ5_9BACT|nr:hypothetical protein AW736_14115 [Opitutaceae bacterium TSB47]
MKYTPTTSRALPRRHIIPGLLAVIISTVSLAAAPATATKQAPAAAKTAVTGTKSVQARADVTGTVRITGTKSMEGTVVTATKTYECTKCTQRKDGTITTPPPTTVGGEKCKHTWNSTPASLAQYKHTCTNQGCTESVTNTSSSPSSQMLSSMTCNTLPHTWAQIADHGSDPIGFASSRAYTLVHKCSKCNFVYTDVNDNIKATPPKNNPAGTSCGSNHNYVFVEGFASYRCNICRRTERLPFGASVRQSGKPPPPPPAKTCPTKHAFKSAPYSPATYTHKCSGCNKTINASTSATAPDTRDCPKGPHVWK